VNDRRHAEISNCGADEGAVGDRSDNLRRRGGYRVEADDVVATAP
jgi:hypothetical protein